MKIIVTAEGEGLGAQIDSRFARAKMFILVDTETLEVENFDNVQVLNVPQGAGIQAAKNVVERGAEAVLTGHCGPNAFRALKSAGIRIYLGAEGTVREAVESLKKGLYEEAGTQDVEGEWI